jgi:hypothetical protein
MTGDIQHLILESAFVSHQPSAVSGQPVMCGLDLSWRAPGSAPGAKRLSLLYFS